MVVVLQINQLFLDIGLLLGQARYVHNEKKNDSQN